MAIEEGLQISKLTAGIGWADSVQFFRGNYDPNGVLTASRGSLFLRDTVGAADQMYRNLDGGTVWALTGSASDATTVYVSVGGSNTAAGTRAQPLATISGAITRFYTPGKTLIVYLRANETHTIEDYETFAGLVDVQFTTYDYPGEAGATVPSPETVTVGSVDTTPTADAVAVFTVTGFARSWGTNELKGASFLYANGRVGWVIANGATAGGSTQITVTSGDENTALTIPVPTNTLSFYTNSGGSRRLRHAIIQGPDSNYGLRQATTLNFQWIEFVAGSSTARAILLEVANVKFDYCFFGTTVERISTFQSNNYLWLNACYVACSNTNAGFGMANFEGIYDVLRIEGGGVFDGVNAASNAHAVGSNVQGFDSLLTLAGRTICRDTNFVIQGSMFRATGFAADNTLRAFLLSAHRGGTAVYNLAGLRDTEWVNGPGPLPNVRGTTTATYTVVAHRNVPLVRLGESTNVIDATGTNSLSCDGGSTRCSGDVYRSTRVQLHQDVGQISPPFTGGTDITLNVAGTDFFQVDLQAASGSINITMLQPVRYGSVMIEFIQGSVARQVNNWDVGVPVFWAGGTAPTLSAGNDQIDLIELFHDGTRYIGRAVAQNVS